MRDLTDTTDRPTDRVGARRRRVAVAGMFAKAAMASWFVLAAMPVVVAIVALT